MNSAASAAPGNGTGYRESDPAVPSSNRPVFTSQLPEESSVWMATGIRPEDAQDHEATRQRSGPLDRTRQNVQERAQGNNKPLPSSNRSNTRAETNSNPVVAAHSSSRPQGPPASQSRSFVQGDTTSRNIGEQRGADERTATRGFPTHRSSEDRVSRSGSSANRPTYGGQASSGIPAAATQVFVQPPIPRTLPPNVNVMPTDVDQQAANTGTAQHPPQPPGEFDQAATSSRDRGDVYASTINPARNNDAGGRVPYTSNPSIGAGPRSGTSPQNQRVSNAAPVVSRAPPLPLPVSQTNRSDEQSANPPSSLTSSVRARDQPGSDSTIIITSTTVGNPPAPLPRHPSTQNVNTAPTYMNPWAVDSEPSQRPSQRQARFDQAAMSSRNSGDRELASNPSSTTTRKDEPVVQAPYIPNPAAGIRTPQSATPTQNLNVSKSASAASRTVPASQTNRSEVKRSTASFASPLFSGTGETDDQDNVSSGSVVTTAQTPFSEPSATPLRGTGSYQNPSASVSTPQRPGDTEERATSESLRGGDHSYTREYNPNALSSPASQTSQSDKEKPSASFSSLLSNLAKTTVPDHAGALSTLTSAPTPASDPSAPQTRTTWGPPNPNPTAVATSHQQSTLTGDARGLEVFENRHDGTSRKQDKEPVTLKSLMAKQKSLDLTAKLTTQPGDPARGGIAEVLEGSLRNEKVAVKVLRTYRNWRVDSHVGASSELHITTMMPIWATLKHRNICKFLGYSTEFGDYPALISTWCSGKNSLEYLRNHPVQVEKRIKLAQGVAEGLQYLHSHTPEIVHGDLTPTNILVDENGVAQLCDIGLTRLPEWQRVTEISASPYTGGGRYRAPELFITLDNPHPVVTSEGDIYSLGCVMLKFIEEFHPFARFPVQDIKKQILNGNPPALRDSQTTALGDMANFFWNQLEGCWDEPPRRPRIEEVVNALDKLANNLPLVRSDGPQGSSKKGDYAPPPPPYPGKVVPGPATVTNTTANYGSNESIPPQGTIPVNLSFGGAVGLITGRSTPIGKSSTNAERNPDYFDYSQASGTSLHSQGSRAVGYNVGSDRGGASGGSVMTEPEIEPLDQRNPTPIPLGPVTKGSGNMQSRQPLPSVARGSPIPLGPVATDPVPANPAPARNAGVPDTANMGGRRGGPNGGEGGGGHGSGGGNTVGAGGGRNNSNDLERGVVSDGAAENDAKSGGCLCC